MMGLPGMGSKGVMGGTRGGSDAACNLLVNYLPSSYDEARFKELFAAHGNVEKVKLITDPQTGLSRCYGFISYSTPQEASRALRRLCGAEIEGKKLRVAYAQPNVVPGPSPSHNVFFTGFATALNERSLAEMCRKYGDVQEVKVLDPVKHPKGVGFVRFRNVEQAEHCVKNLNMYEVRATGTTVTLNVKFAERKQQRGHHGQHHRGGGMHMPQHMMGFFPGMGGTGAGNTVFVHGLSGSTEQEIHSTVFSIFGGIGRIAKVDVPKLASGEPRNFCFVHFGDMQSAQAALALNGQPYGGKPLQVRFK